MPLNSDSYLRKRGWQGSGSGLRKGGLVKPLTIPQKKTLAGIGKDRDDSYPFWDHLFTAASKAINIRIHLDDNDNDHKDHQDNPSNPLATSVSLSLQKTRTGIVSSLRPIHSDSHAASAPFIASSAPHLSLVTLAKQEAARQQLYSLFYRGADLLPEKDSFSGKEHPYVDQRNLFKKTKKQRREKVLEAPGNDSSQVNTLASSTMGQILSTYPVVESENAVADRKKRSKKSNSGESSGPAPAQSEIV